MTYTEKIVLASSEYFQNFMIEDPDGYIYLVLYISLLIAKFNFVVERFDYKLEIVKK